METACAIFVGILTDLQVKVADSATVLGNLHVDDDLTTTTGN